METIFMANPSEVDNIVEIDREVIDNNSRREYIEEAIKTGRCIVVNNEISIVGFLIFDTHFFGNSFISLIVVSTSQRRKGYAAALIDYFVNMAPTPKIFSSTNKSNKNMQNVFTANGFVQSGVIENLDEGDQEIIYFKTK
ncbi:GNAT family N-acetyltransferase [Virgibacillus necropolis]|uniref:GNAT family N-acetyltransferase n=1 Tax=Virgibacillus necropolis TaxID=163877 RepID=A0A221MFG1_9BACI|nr:GNAT family N-acetyltransferase [Virgibacillus necropolis]ASN06408.1 GNAT family N-acetyltransferase [Virgibacillus necropolis]